MGDRVSISFVQDRSEVERKMFGGPKQEESVVLFNHWGGEQFPKEAVDYLRELHQEKSNFEGDPLGRLEVSTVMVDFMRWFLGGPNILQPQNRVTRTIYLGTDPNDGDNSDNGHFTINVDTFGVERFT